MFKIFLGIIVVHILSRALMFYCSIFLYIFRINKVSINPTNPIMEAHMDPPNRGNLQTNIRHFVMALL